MGQLRHRHAIFLSAGVPDPSAAHFEGEGDSAAIAAAVGALLYVTLGRRQLVWGGHPAITPMVWAFAEAMEVDYGDWVTLYQSAIFEDEFPEETARFENVIVTQAVGADKTASLEAMRRRMIQENSFDAAVFIGGMRGIYDEHQLFIERAPNAKVLPIMSTGGAAEKLGSTVGAATDFLDELDYVALFHRHLGIDPNEPRSTPRRGHRGLR
jgi:SLOG cluster3 family